MKKSRSLKDIELFLFDMDGTIYVGSREIEGAFDTVKRLKAAGKRVCFFTNNSSRAHTDYIDKLAAMGLAITADEIYTSGQVTGAFLKDSFPGKTVYLLGNPKLKKEIESYGVKVVEDNPDVIVLGFDTTLTYDRLNKFCEFAGEGKPYIATHPDNNCPHEPYPMPDIGGFIEAIRLTVGKTPDYIAGKPYELAGEGVKKRFNLPSEKIAMVGDRLYTDIKFGLNNGFKSILVLTGETDLEMLDASNVKPDLTLDSVVDILDLI